MLPGFGPAAELVAWRVSKGTTIVVEAKGANNGRALRDALCTIDAPPGPFNEMAARHRRASQLATLKQGSPDHESVHPEGRAAGVGLDFREYGIENRREFKGKILVEN